MNGDHLEKTLTDAGFVDVKVRQIALPCGIGSKGFSLEMDGAEI